MSEVTFTASLFSEDTQQEVRVIVYDKAYASIELPTMELMLDSEQLRKLGRACLVLADVMERRA